MARRRSQAHVHCQWVPQIELEVDPNNKRFVHRFLKAQMAIEAGGGSDATWEIEGEGDEGRRGGTEEEPYNPDFEVVERVFSVTTQEEDDLPPAFAEPTEERLQLFLPRKPGEKVVEKKKIKMQKEKDLWAKQEAAKQAGSAIGGKDADIMF